MSEHSPSGVPSWNEEEVIFMSGPVHTKLPVTSMPRPQFPYLVDDGDSCDSIVTAMRFLAVSKLPGEQVTALFLVLSYMG